MKLRKSKTVTVPIEIVDREASLVPCLRYRAGLPNCSGYGATAAEAERELRRKLKGAKP